MKHGMVAACLVLHVVGAGCSKKIDTSAYAAAGSSTHEFFINAECAFEDAAGKTYADEKVVVFPRDQLIFVNERDASVTIQFTDRTVLGRDTITLQALKREAVQVPDVARRATVTDVAIVTGCTGGGQGPPQIIIGDWP